MSRPLRNPRIQKAAARALAAYLRVTLKTIRWRWINREAIEAVWASRVPVIVCFWHSRIPLSPACWSLDQGQPARALISLSADGEFIAQAMARIGFPAIRGSAAKPSDPAKAKGGAVAFRDGLKWLRGGNCIAITPDGPRGPAERMTEGPPMLAGMSGAPVMLVGLAAKPCIRLNSWDRTVLPLPFGRGVIVWDDPLRLEGRTQAGELAELAEAWAARLTAVTERAEAEL